MATGIIYGKVWDSNGGPLSTYSIILNWVQRADGNPLSVAGDDNLSIAVPRCTTTSSGEYVIPFYWNSTQVPGDLTSVLAMHWLTNNAYLPQTQHGSLRMGGDVKALIKNITPSTPSGGADAASMFLTFFMAATPELKGMDMLVRFVQSTSLLSTDQQGCFSNVDFFF